jgi:pilus assembly protein CpaF
MCMMADVGLPLAALRRQVALALDLVVQSARLHSGRRLLTHVSEIGLDEATNTYRIHDLFSLETAGDEPTLRWTGRRPALADEIGWKGLAGDVKLTRKMFAAKGGA